MSEPGSVRTSNDAVAQNQRELLSQLSGHPFLEGLSDEQLSVLAANAMAVEFKPGEVIFREGDNANRFYLLQSGEVVLETHDANTQTTAVIDRIGAGSVLGWSWLFPPYAWKFDARATQPTRAVFFYGSRLREQSEMDHSLGFALARKVAEVAIGRLQSTRRQLLERSK